MDAIATMAADQTYEDTKRLVFKLAEKHARRFELDRDDVISEAHQHYMWAYNTHQEDLGKFNKRLAFVVYKRLLQSQRLKTRRGLRVGMVPACGFDADTHSRESSFSLVDFKDELSADGKELVDIALHTPGYVFRCERNVTTVPSQKILRLYMRELGWTDERFFDAFENVASALEDRCE